MTSTTTANAASVATSTPTEDDDAALSMPFPQDDPIFIYSGNVQQVVGSLDPHRAVTSATVMGAEDLDVANALDLVSYLQQTPSLTQLDLTCSLASPAVADILSQYLQSQQEEAKEAQGEGEEANNKATDAPQLTTSQTQQLPHRLESISCCGSRRPGIDDLLLQALAVGLQNNTTVQSLYCSGFGFTSTRMQQHLQALLMGKTNFHRLDLNFCDFDQSNDDDDDKLLCLMTGLAAQTELRELSMTCCKLNDETCAAVIQSLVASGSKLVKLGLFENYVESASLSALEGMLASPHATLRELHVHKSFLSSTDPEQRRRRRQRFTHLLQCRNTSLQRLIVGLGGGFSSGGAAASARVIGRDDNTQLEQYCQRNVKLAHTQRFLLKQNNSNSNNNNKTKKASNGNNEDAVASHHYDDAPSSTASCVTVLLGHLARQDPPLVGASAMFLVLQTGGLLLA